LQKAGVPSQFVLVPGGQHGPGVLIDKYFKMMTDFFAAQAKITNVETQDRNFPIKFSVSQNYPNPFNPSTTITFSLSEKAFVTLKVFDSLGREVSKLVSEEMLPGTYSKQWNAEGFPSGTYFARLEAGSYIATKKLVLLK